MTFEALKDFSIFYNQHELHHQKSKLFQFYFKSYVKGNTSEQDGPSLESSLYVFECEFEISWSFGPLDLGTLGPWDSWTSSLL